MSGDRDIRDALAEALWRGAVRERGYGSKTWNDVQPAAKTEWCLQADRLLAALPSVKPRLKLVLDEDPSVSLKIVREA